VAHLIKKAHPAPINRVHFVNDYLLLSGDDDGLTKVWDLRTSECVFEAHEQSEAITGLLFDEDHTNVLASSLDGTIAVYDIRQGFDSPHKLYARTDSPDEELHGL
jgi:WD40 repeat protein